MLRMYSSAKNGSENTEKNNNRERPPREYKGGSGGLNYLPPNQ